MTAVCAASRYGLPVSAQRARSAAPKSDRSIYPKISGVPWWAAIFVALIATAIGFAFDAGSGNKELTTVFAAFYVAGCVAAVLAVRQSGLFTAVVQPPLLLFCAVPGAYWLFHGAKIGGVKDILINCGYPLIERFPLMVLTSAGVLLIGATRWYLGTRTRSGAISNGDADAEAADTLKGGSAGKLARFLSRGATDTADEQELKAPRRAHTVGQASKRTGSRSTARSRSGDRSSTRRSTPTRSRRPRSPLEDAAEAGVDRVPRRRPRPVRDVDGDGEPPAVPRRRARPVRDPDLRSQPPREMRRDPHSRYAGPPARSSRFDPYEPVEPYDPPPRRRPVSEAAGMRANSTHHPVSQVRYRGAARTHKARSSAAESWEYDI
jgi:hypothetical protein